MPCYLVSSGVEIPMTNETFAFIWNGFGNKELTDSETSLSENYKAISSAQKPTQNPNGESRTTDTTTENQPKRISKDITKRKRSNLVYVIYAALP